MTEERIRDEIARILMPAIDARAPYAKQMIVALASLVISARAEGSPQGWQPIETAPKDGTVVDVWLGEADEDECEFYCGSRTNRRSTNWRYQAGKFRPRMGLSLPVVTVRPTHWIEIPPAPPAPGSAEEGR